MGQGGGGQSALSQAGSTLESMVGRGFESADQRGLRDLFGGGGGQRERADHFPDAAFGERERGHQRGRADAAIRGGLCGGRTTARRQRRARGGSTQITVQVQAMDSQSFLDHSDDIAQAVRQAMLQSSVLNDVIREV